MSTAHRKTHVTIMRASNNAIVWSYTIDKQLDPTADLLSLIVPLAAGLVVGVAYKFSVVYESASGEKSPATTLLYTPQHGDELRPIAITKALAKDLVDPTILRETPLNRTTLTPIFYTTTIGTQLTYTHDTYKSLTWEVFLGADLLTAGSSTLAYDPVNKVLKPINEFTVEERNTVDRLCPAFEVTNELAADTPYTVKCSVLSNRLGQTVRAEKTIFTGKVPTPVLNIQPYSIAPTISGSTFEELFGGGTSFVDTFLEAKWKIIDTLSGSTILDVTVVGDGVLSHHATREPITKHRVALRNTYLPGTHLTVSCQYKGALFGWSAVATEGFTIADVNITTPTVTIAPSFYLTPKLFVTSLISTPTATLDKVLWVIYRQSDSSIVHTAEVLGNTTDPYEYTVPDSILQNAVAYQATAQHVTDTLGTSLPSARYSFTTPAAYALSKPRITITETPYISLTPTFTMMDVVASAPGTVITGYDWTITPTNPAGPVINYTTTHATLNIKTARSVANTLHVFPQDTVFEVTGKYRSNTIPESELSDILTVTTGGINPPDFTVPALSPLLVPLTIQPPVVRRPSNDTTPIKMVVSLAGPALRNSAVNNWAIRLEQEYASYTANVAVGGFEFNPFVDRTVDEAFRVSARAHVRFISATVGSSPDNSSLDKILFAPTGYQKSFNVAALNAPTIVCTLIKPNGTEEPLPFGGIYPQAWGWPYVTVPALHGLRVTATVTGSNIPNQSITYEQHGFYVTTVDPVTGHVALVGPDYLETAPGLHKPVSDNTTKTGAHSVNFTFTAAELATIPTTTKFAGYHVRSSSAADSAHGLFILSDANSINPTGINATYTGTANGHQHVFPCGRYNATTKKLLVPVLTGTAPFQLVFSVGILDLNIAPGDPISAITLHNFGVDFSTNQITAIQNHHYHPPDASPAFPAIWSFSSHWGDASGQIKTFLTFCVTDTQVRHLYFGNLQTPNRDWQNPEANKACYVSASTYVKNPATNGWQLALSIPRYLYPYGYGTFLLQPNTTTHANSPVDITHTESAIVMPYSQYTLSNTNEESQICPTSALRQLGEMARQGFGPTMDGYSWFSWVNTFRTEADPAQAYMQRKFSGYDGPDADRVVADPRFLGTTYVTNIKAGAGIWADCWAVGVKNRVPHGNGQVSSEQYSFILERATGADPSKDLTTYPTANFGADFTTGLALISPSLRLTSSDSAAYVLDFPQPIIAEDKMFWFSPRVVNNATPVPVIHYLVLNKLTNTAVFKHVVLPPALTQPYMMDDAGYSFNRGQHIKLSATHDILLIMVTEAPNPAGGSQMPVSKTVIVHNP